MRFSYLFVILKGSVSTYHYRDGRLELIRYKGGDTYSGELKDFWSWWSRTSAFLENHDTVDFCFLSDKEAGGLPPVLFRAEEDSLWCWELLEPFLQMRFSFSKLVIRPKERPELVSPDGSEGYYVDTYPHSVKLWGEAAGEAEVAQPAEEGIVLKESDLAHYYKMETKRFSQG